MNSRPSVHYEYRAGRFGLVAERVRRCGPDAFGVERIRYLGRGPRAQRIVALLRREAA